MKQSEMATKTMLGMPWLKIGYGNVDKYIDGKIITWSFLGFFFSEWKGLANINSTLYSDDKIWL